MENFNEKISITDDEYKKLLENNLIIPKIGLTESEWRSQKERMPYQSPASGSIPIIAIWPIPKQVYDKLNWFSESNPSGEAYHKALEIMERLNEAGFNVVMNGGNFEQMNAMIYTAEKFGVNTIISSSFLYESPGTLLFIFNEYKDKHQPVAYQIMDEPKYRDWGGFNVNIKELRDNQAWNRLTVADRILSNFAPDKMRLFNLATPNLSQKTFASADEEAKFNKTKQTWIGGFDTYEEYLDNLDMLLTPSCWSYDLYPFVKKGNSQEFDPAEITHFYHYLRIFSERYKNSITGGDQDTPLENNQPVPFWTYCMSIAHTIYTMKDELARKFEPAYKIIVESEKNGSNIPQEKVESAKKILSEIRLQILTDNIIVRRMPAPTAGMLRFQTFMSLAFGSQGIVYWSYAPFIDVLFDINYASGKDESTYHVYYGGVVNMEGDPTVQWEYAKQVNEEVRYYTPVFLDSYCIEQRQFSLGDDIEGITSFEAPFGCIQDLEMLSIDELTEQDRIKSGLLLTRMRGRVNGKKYIVIVNQNYEREQKIKFVLRGNTYNRIYSYPDPVITNFPSSGTGLIRPLIYEPTLLPGGCIVIEY